MKEVNENLKTEEVVMDDTDAMIAADLAKAEAAREEKTNQVQTKDSGYSGASILEVKSNRDLGDLIIGSLDDKREKQATALSKTLAQDTNVLEFGEAAQNKLSAFSEKMITTVNKEDIGPIGESLTELMDTINSSDVNALSIGKKNGFFNKIFGKVQKSIREVTSKYESLGTQMDQVAKKLNHDKDGLMKDNKMLDELYEKNKDYFDSLNVYIAASEMRIREIDQVELPAAMAKAEASGDQMDGQAVQDLANFKNRLEKRNHDLMLTRQITIQQAPQIRLIQNTNQELAEKIQASINTALPLWKNQIAIALTLLRQKDAVTAQKQVSQTTNELLSKNSEMLKMSAIETAEESERGIVDIETLQKTQNDLIETIAETIRIQQAGRENRKQQSAELANMEIELKEKLLELGRIQIDSEMVSK